MVGGTVNTVRSLSGSASGFATMTASRSTPAPTAKYEGSTNGRGEPHGEGKRIFASGHTYEGKWQDGRCHGYGKFTYPDGQIFEGEWKDGRRNGEGKLMMPDGQVIAGNWVDDALSGPVRRWAEGSQNPPARAIAPAAPAAPTGASAPASEPAAANDAADVAWLRESHDVIWQLNVELQMENERLVGENRRLRLKLRQMLQEQQQKPALGGCGQSGDAPESKPKVVEGRLRRKKKDGESGNTKGKVATGKVASKDWLDKLVSGASSELDAFLSGSKAADGTTAAPPEDEGDKRRRLADELCAKAESELTDRLLGAEWNAMKRVGSPGDAEAYARQTFKTKLDKVRHSAAVFLGDSTSLAQAAREARDALDAVASWPAKLQAMSSRSGMDVDAMLSARDLRLDQCGLAGAGVGAACVLLRASRVVQTVDLGSNQVGDEGVQMLCEALRGHPTLQTMRLHANALGPLGGQALADLLLSNRSLAKLDVRGNHFDALSEQALRTAGGGRVVIHESDNKVAMPVPTVAVNDAPAIVPPIANQPDAFIAYTDQKAGGKTAAAESGSQADAFLEFSDRKNMLQPSVAFEPATKPRMQPTARDAEAFNSFSRGDGFGAVAPTASKAKGVGFTGARMPTADAADFLASLGDD